MNLLIHRSPNSSKTPRHLLLGCLVAFIGPAAFAIAPAPDADLDDISAHLHRSEHGWEIEVSFEVELEFDDDVPMTGEYALVLNIQNNGRPILDQSHRPLEIAFPLDKPTKEDDDELEFKGKLTIVLEPQDITDPRKVSMVARVMRLDDDLTLDHKRFKVKYRGKDDDDDDDMVAVAIEDRHGVVCVNVPYVNLVVRW